ncbi:MAG TPA: class I SAM-dependent methyltransferase, partial [Candidatus Dormibacteraeota bacterium]|nr:class I SAM-dependent methyltransferase [Candidatus Dormibacteraeota bacterium]
MNSDDWKARQASSFGAIASIYRRGRPSYPTEALDWLVPEGSPRVLDLGAGTGKLTEQLVARGLDVVAVEPSDGMREEFAKALPGVPILAGAGESIPLDDASVDAVLVAQAWHWVDPERAVPEVARVLRPGGRLGLIWNVRDEREAWLADLGRIIHVEGDQDMHTNDAVAGPPFGPFEHTVIEWTHHLSPDRLIDMVTS